MELRLNTYFSAEIDYPPFVIPTIRAANKEESAVAAGA